MAKTRSLGKDTFDNPLYDALLIFLDQHRQEFADAEFSGWFDFEVSAVIDSCTSLSSIDFPDKPRVEPITCTWQHPLVEIRAVGKAIDYSRKKLASEVVGMSDITLTYWNFKLSCGYKGNDAHWKVERDARPTQLHVICRPALVSVAGTIRDIQKLRLRKNQSEYGHDQRHENEQFAVLTANTQHKDIFLEQGITYICVAPDTLENGVVPW